MQDSYAEAAAGLRAYAAAVRQTAGEATVQQRLIAQSEAELGQAQTQQASWVAPPDPVTGHPDPSVRNPHDTAVDAAQASVRRAQARLAGLAVQRRAADRRVVDTLHRAHGAGMQNKHWWQMSVGKEGKTAGEMLSSAREEWQAASKVERQPMQPPPEIHPGKQGKHIRSHRGFIPGKSELTADPHELVKAAGTGHPVGNKPRGVAGFKERVDFDKVIGIYVSRTARVETTRAMIAYDKDGLVHIYPVRPAP